MLLHPALVEQLDHSGVLLREALLLFPLALRLLARRPLLLPLPPQLRLGRACALLLLAPLPLSLRTDLLLGELRLGLPRLLHEVRLVDAPVGREARAADELFQCLGRHLGQAITRGGGGRTGGTSRVVRLLGALAGADSARLRPGFSFIV